ncbi:phage portal protein [Massilia sp. RP-1-19]|uniref:Phage portal protein n=1 Tax=Massilia polaris TaxID=2728846 RepID=A0A848HNW2_9BURK|nr:phage portal protein [Massilia polaris]NML61819.1 phage portal protein [Massilia polaris]
MKQATWYNAERVSQPGSVVLNAWRAERVQASNTSQQNLTVQELANLISGAGGVGGPSVSETTAMRVSAVYACVALIAGAISTLPMPVYARSVDGREIVDHPYFWLLNESPNDDLSAAVFWEFMVSSRLFYGDCFAEILRPSFRSSKVTGFVPHHPNRVQPFRDTAGNLFYRVTPLLGAQYTVHPADMIHVPSLGFDGLRSPSPITYAARQAVGTALSADEYNSRFFTNGARPDFAITAPGSLSEDQANMIRSTWNDKHAGVAKSHMPAVLMGGLDIKQLSLSAADSQILATSMFQVEQIARVLGVPPHMIGHTDKSTSWGAGVENMGRGFVKFTLKRDLVKFEQEFNRKLWPTRERLFLRFDLADIERGDLKSENEALRIALGRAGEPGWMTQNEVRKAKNLPPKDNGDELLEVTAVAPAPSPTEKTTDEKSAAAAG